MKSNAKKLLPQGPYTSKMGRTVEVRLKNASGSVCVWKMQVEY